MDADGSIHTAFANGTERHIAQIGRPGQIRIWNEDETQGEAYIPLAQSKRSRSEAILSTVAEQFGGAFVKPQAFADGAVVQQYITASTARAQSEPKPVTVSLEGAEITGRLEFDKRGMVQLIDGRIVRYQ